MRKILITEADENQRLDKFLLKYMNNAPKSFVYKMLRKKNIKLNEGRAQGGETLAKGDRVELYLSEETLAGFMSPGCVNMGAGPVSVVYEDGHILVCDKPWGVLSHPGARGDGDTMAGRLLLHLWKNGEYNPDAPGAFTPAPANRLDRNTTGLLACGKTLAAAQWLAKAFRERKAEKRYTALVAGTVRSSGRLTGFHEKDEAANRVVISGEMRGPAAKEATLLYAPVWSKNGFSCLDVALVTGRSHQIRAQLAQAGWPVIGDAKYGDGRVNEIFRRGAGVGFQLLHAGRLTFTEDTGALSYLAGRTFTAEPPTVFARAESYIDYI